MRASIVADHVIENFPVAARPNRRNRPPTSEVEAKGNFAMSLANSISKGPTVKALISSHGTQSLLSTSLRRQREAKLFGNAVSTRSVNTTPSYEGHIPLNWFENAVLAVGSAVMSLADPRRGGEYLSEVHTTNRMTYSGRYGCCVGRDNCRTQLTSFARHYARKRRGTQNSQG